MHLRSVELQMPNRAAAVDWGIASRDNGALAASSDTSPYA